MEVAVEEVAGGNVVDEEVEVEEGEGDEGEGEPKVGDGNDPSMPVVVVVGTRGEVNCAKAARFVAERDEPRALRIGWEGDAARSYLLSLTSAFLSLVEGCLFGSSSSASFPLSSSCNSD